MASLPPSQRRSSARRRSESDHIDASASSAHADHRDSSEDSETVLLSPVEGDNEKTAPPQTESAAIASAGDAQDSRRCWICFADEVEDTPETSAWKSPCPCALTAHEACLLDWIADMEAPTSRRRAGQQHKIECPQCKAEIAVARPGSWIVDGVRAVEKSCQRVMLPGVLLISATSVCRLFFEYGMLTIEAVFGPEDADQILGPLFMRPELSGNAVENLINHLKATLPLTIGLPLVPPVLILSRTSFGDGVLPILPILFLATAPSPDPLSGLNDWPPSASLSFAMLPYARSIYNLYYEKVWGERERRWLREIQPRSSDESLEGGDVEDIMEAMDDDHDIEIRMEVLAEILDAGQNAPQDDIPGEIALGEPANEPQQNEAGAAVGEDQAAQQLPPAQAVQAEQRAPLQFTTSAPRLAETVLGALAFPFVSSIMGDVLRTALPKAWTTPSARKPGFLQTRWARTLVGGCLFVVLKDTIMLYVKWKMAQNHRKRKVLNYDKVRKRIIWE